MTVPIARFWRPWKNYRCDSEARQCCLPRKRPAVRFIVINVVGVGKCEAIALLDPQLVFPRGADRDSLVLVWNFVGEGQSGKS